MMEYNKDYNKQHPDYDPNNQKKKLPMEDDTKRREMEHKERVIRARKEEYAKAETAKAPWPFPKPAPDRMKEPYGRSCGDMVGKTPEHDMVESPKHYMLFPGIEVRDLMKRLVEKMVKSGSLTAMQMSDYVQAMQYFCRFMEKGGKEDLEKGVWYMNKVIEAYE